MIKRMTMLARKDGMSVPEFRNHWYVNHAKIVKQMPRLGRYLQNHVIRKIVPDIGDAAFSVDGIPELWFADEDAKNAALQSPAAKALPVDERNFMRGITIFAIDETVVRSGDGGAKVMLLSRSGKGKGNELAVSGVAGSWIGRLANELPGTRRSVVNRVVSTDRRSGVWCEPNPPDTIIELRFDSEEAADKAFQSSEFTGIASEAAREEGAIAVLLVEEKAIV